ncbi:MAG: ATP-binding cassette domain-containing protein [Sphaerobacter sp.]|nr:ATP-binding cassette domain-containing protein [Sphaerobacter sp.]
MAIQTRPQAGGATAAPPELAITAHDLVKTYRGGIRALDGLSLAVEAGTIFALLGPNGAGKSTTVRILTTLARPDAGSARVAGYDVVAQPDRVRRAIGYVSQKSAVDPEATGRENLTLQGRIYGLRGRELRQRVAELLERMGLADAADRVAGTYSGGMQRKLDILMGLIHRPRVLFLDEPTTGLDPEARAELWAEIARLAREEHLTVLLTTHYLEEADRLAHRLAIVDRGRTVVEGTPEQLKGELQGHTIRIELAAAVAEPRIQAALAPLPGLREVSLRDGAIYARADSGGAAIPAVLAALEASGVPVAAATVARPSLDDVYLRYVGRALDAATGKETGR